MYPPLSQLFSSTDEPDNNPTLPIETSLKDVGMNIKVFDINIDDDGEKETKTSTESTQKPPSPTTKGDTSPTSVNKPPLVKKTSTGSLISSRAARIQGLMDHDLRPNKYDNQEIINGQGKWCASFSKSCFKGLNTKQTSLLTFYNRASSASEIILCACLGQMSDINIGILIMFFCDIFSSVPANSPL